jgi:hypothetical protein
MQAITVRDRDAGIGGLSLTDMPYPQAAENDVIVRVHAAGVRGANMTLDDVVMPAAAASAAALEVASAYQSPALLNHSLRAYVGGGPRHDVLATATSRRPAPRSGWRAAVGPALAAPHPAF